MEVILERLGLLSQPRFVGEEVSRRGVGKQQAEGPGIDEEVESHLGGALGAQPTLSASAVGVVEGPDAIERAASGLSVLVPGTGGAGVQDPHIDRGAQCFDSRCSVEVRLVCRNRGRYRS